MGHQKQKRRLAASFVRQASYLQGIEKRRERRQNKARKGEKSGVYVLVYRFTIPHLSP
jgi:hypothetical protein